MKRRLRMLGNVLRLLLLTIRAVFAKLGGGNADKKRVLDLFWSLGASDKALYLSSVTSALKQIDIAASGEGRGATSPVRNSVVRNSECVFILGSGPSINDLSQANFDQISKHDSWGFNFWFVHEFVPQVYFAQIGKARKRNVGIMEAWDTSFKKVAHKYSNTDFVLKGGDLFHGFDLSRSLSFKQLHEAAVASISTLPTLLIPKDVNRNGDELFDDLKQYDLLRAGTGISAPVPQIRSTVGLLVVLAVQMGYKEIVLCGVDGRDRAHFFDQERYMAAFPELKAIPESYKVVEHPHGIVEKTGLSPLDYLVVLAAYCKENFDVELKVASDQSYLSDKLTRYTFEDEFRSVS